MTNSIVQTPTLEIDNIGGTLVVDSRVIATQLGVKHKATMQLIRNNIEDLKDFGHLPFEMATVTNSVGAVNQETFCYLNEDQSTYLMTLSKNTEQVKLCKKQLVRAFSAAKSIIKTVIPAQNDRIRELELEVRLAELKNTAINNASLLVAMHGEALGLTIAGLNVGQLIEVKIPVTEVLNPVTGNCDEFLDAKQLATEVARRSGQKVKNADFIRKLKSANRDDLILPVTRNATCEYVRSEDIDEAIEVVYGRCKQQLLVPSQSAIV